MGLHAWTLRCIPGLSIVALFILILYALTPLAPPPPTSCPHRYHKSSPADTHCDPLDQLSWPQTIFVIYNVFIHLLAALFPIRLCWSLWQITGQVQDLVSQHITTLGVDTKSRTIGSPASSLSPIETSSTASSDTLYFDNDEEQDSKVAPGMVTHAILLPNYKEDVDTFRETLDVLASHAQARSSYDVWLAMEEKDNTALATASTLVETYAKFFRNIRYTMHPSGLPREVQGKSSNISWAGKRVSESIKDLKARQNCVMTVMDADTHLSSNFFAQLTKLHFEYPETANTTIYAAPIIFDRNAHKVPILVRLADIVWCAAGLSGLYPGSTIIIPTSVYSLPLTLVEEVGGWDTHAMSIGEDLHMYLKCYFGVGGRLTSRVIYSPASQSNVASDGAGYRGWIKSIQARYRQAMRHMWGSLDSGFAIDQAGCLASRLMRNNPDGPFPGPTCPSLMSMSMLVHRLFEAHFLTVHLFILLLSGGIYQLFVSPKDTPPLILTSLNLAGNLRAGAFVLMLCGFFAYESYHNVCVRAREDEMRRAQLYQRMRGDISKFGKRGFTHWIQYIMFPISGIIFVTVPSILAQLAHFRTDKLEYEVSLKPSVMSSRLFELLDVEQGVEEHELEDEPASFR